MLTELNWQLLDERRRIARLVMFYKMVAITMPLKSKNVLITIQNCKFPGLQHSSITM